MRRIPIFKNLSFSKMLKVLEEIVVSILRKVGRILAIVVVIVAKK